MQIKKSKRVGGFVLQTAALHLIGNVIMSYVSPLLDAYRKLVRLSPQHY